MLPAIALTILLAGQTDPGKQIQAQYDRWSKAYMAHDVSTLLQILSPTYTLTAYDKSVMNYATYSAYLKLRAKGPKDTTLYRTKIQKLVRHGDIADVDSIESMTTTLNGKTSVHRHEYLDRWRLSGKSWLLESTTTIKESTSTVSKG